MAPRKPSPLDEHERRIAHLEEQREADHKLIEDQQSTIKELETWKHQYDGGRKVFMVFVAILAVLGSFLTLRWK